MLIVVYIAAFFAVGFLGLQLRSHYSVSYINEIQVLPFEDSGITERSPTTTQTYGDPNDKEHLRVEHEYFYKAANTEGLVLKFTVKLIPEGTTIDDYKLSYQETSMYKITKNEDKTIFVTDIVQSGRFPTDVIFTVEDNHMNGVKSTVSIRVK